MTDDQWRQPSLLPGWTRGHVVSHLTLNAEALSGALEGVHEGRPVPMYRSDEARESDIADLASASPSALRDRFLGSTTVIGEWVEELAHNLADHEVERTPGGRSFPAGVVGNMRVREVEIHHADLALDYTAADWPPEFVVLLLDLRAGVHDGEPFVAQATDLTVVGVRDRGSHDLGRRECLAWWTTAGFRRRTDQRRRPRAEDGAVVY